MKTAGLLAVIAAISCIAFVTSCNKESQGTSVDDVVMTGHYGVYIDTRDAVSPDSYEALIHGFMQEAIDNSLKDLKDVYRTKDNDSKVIMACDRIYENSVAQAGTTGQSFSIVIFFKEESKTGEPDPSKEKVKRYDFFL